MPSIFERAQAARLEMDHHASDLYLKDSPEAQQVILDWQQETGRDSFITYFHSNIDGEQWIDIPFAYDPFWEKKART